MDQQNPTLQKPASEVTVSDAGKPAEQPLDWRQQYVVDYYAIGGLVTTEEGEVKKMTVTELANTLKVDRSTIYDWRDRIPGFWDHVAQARQRLGGQNRVQKVWNGVFLRAAKGDAEQAKMFLANFDPNYKAPGDKSDRNAAETLIDLMNAARQLQREQQGDGQNATPQQQPLTAAPIPQPIIEGETA
jgi:hypothetical protein